jgi:hypothetical protein
MLASRSVVSRLLRGLGDFLYTFKAGLRTRAGGAGLQVVGRVVVPAGCNSPARPRSAAAGGCRRARRRATHALGAAAASATT